MSALIQTSWAQSDWKVPDEANSMKNPIANDGKTIMQGGKNL